MYLTFLRFADRTRAPELMAAHNAWVQKGLAEGAFLAVGSLQPGLGGAILATAASREAHEARLAADPFVAEGVVSAETHEIALNAVAPDLARLRDA